VTSTFTPTLQLEVPARGDYVNTWDLPMDATLQSIDAANGQTATVNTTGGVTILTQAQANCAALYVTGNLTSNAVICYPPTSAGRKMVFPGATVNSFGVYVRGNNGNDQIGVYFLIGFAIPYPIFVTPSRVYWDYGSVGPGSIVSFPTGFVHPGWIPCDGRGANTTQQDLLYDIIGFSYGGSGATFLVPDYRGFALVGSDNMGAGSAGRFFNFGPNGITGEVTHVLSQAEMPSHVHGVGDPGHAHGVSDPGHAHGGVVTGLGVGGPISAAQGWVLNMGNTAGSGTGIGIQAAGTGIYLGAAGSSGGHNNVQPSRTVNKYIRW
jgi:microcystin-dependent protein